MELTHFVNWMFTRLLHVTIRAKTLQLNQIGTMHTGLYTNNLRYIFSYTTMKFGFSSFNLSHWIFILVRNYHNIAATPSTWMWFDSCSLPIHANPKCTFRRSSTNLLQFASSHGSGSTRTDMQWLMSLYDCTRGAIHCHWGHFFTSQVS